MRKEIVKGRVSLLESFIDDNFSIEKLIQEKQMGTLNGRTMECPFHEDVTPSMFVDVKNNRFKCHSCGRGGRYVKLYEHWLKEKEGRSLNYYEVLEDLLKQNPTTSVSLGYHSIFKTKAELMDIQTLSITLKERRTIEPVQDYNLPESARLKKVVDEHAKGLRTTEELLDLFAQVQKGNRPSLNSRKDGEKEKVYATSLEEIMDMIL